MRAQQGASRGQSRSVHAAVDDDPATPQWAMSLVRCATRRTA